jgi:hypothetical protein
LDNIGLSIDMSKEHYQPIINKAKRSPQYKEGAKAFLTDEPRDNNPYELRTYIGSEWDRGWFTYYLKSLPGKGHEQENEILS